MRYLKPNFSNHPLNYIFVLVVGLFFFLFASFAFAYTNHYYGPYVDTTAAYNACMSKKAAIESTGYPTSNSCSNAGSARLIEKRTPLNQGFSLLERHYYSYNSGSCPDGYEIDNDGLCIPPPPPPENCTDLQGQEFILSNRSYYPTEACNFGCSGLIAGIGIVFGDGELSNQKYEYTGTSCPGGMGYDPEKGTDEPEYDPEAPPKVCKDANGYVYGSVSANATCPNRQNCYDDTTGDFTATAAGSSSCPTGTSTNATRDWSDNVATGQTTETTTNPDGSTDTSTNTTYQHTGGDGKTYTTTKRSTTTCDPQGNCTTSTDETTSQASCEEGNCPDGMEAATVSELSNCSAAFQCSGDVLKCAQLELDWSKACSYISDDSIQEWIDSDDFANGVAVETNADGQLSVLDGGTINVEDAFDIPEWMVDDGVTADCPQVVSGWIELDFAPMCSFFSAMRFPVLFFNGIGILMFIRRSTLET